MKHEKWRTHQLPNNLTLQQFIQTDWMAKLKFLKKYFCGQLKNINKLKNKYGTIR